MPKQQKLSPEEKVKIIHAFRQNRTSSELSTIL